MEEIRMKSRAFGSEEVKNVISEPDSTASEDFFNRKRGVGVCTISRGTVPIKWVSHMDRVKKLFPGGLYWKVITTVGLSWAAARNECVRKCRACNFQYLFFIDDDVFIPDFALQDLLKAKKDIITGVYWTKTRDCAPVIFEKMGSGPMYDFEVDKIIPIGGSGLGCCLINMDVFDKFDDAGIPYFVENWVYTEPDGMRTKCQIGEDHYFFLKAREFGYQAHAHTGVLCDHMDVKTGKTYPPENVVVEYCKNKLKEEGENHIVEEFDRTMQDDPTKQTIVIYNNNVPFAGDELSRRGVGGAENQLIQLARELAKVKKYNVKVYCQCLREGVYDSVLYKDNSKFWDDMENRVVDLLIVSRNTDFFLSDELNMQCYNFKKKILWAHDLPIDVTWNDIEETHEKIDQIVAVSEWHMRDILEQYPFLAGKVTFIENGVDSSRYTKKVPLQKGKCVYTSTPYRGLDILLKIWPKIKENVPNAELHVFSSIKVYGEYFDDSPWEHLYHQAKNTPGVKYRGTIKQDKLALEQMSSQLLLYPNTFRETFCIIAAESQMAGVPVICTNQAALPVTVGEGCGTLISGDPNSEEYQQKFVDAAVEYLTNDEKWNKAHDECLKRDFSWNKMIPIWIDKFLK